MEGARFLGLDAFTSKDAYIGLGSVHSDYGDLEGFRSSAGDPDSDAPADQTWLVLNINHGTNEEALAV